jgi:predicted transcriptional regulator
MIQETSLTAFKEIIEELGDRQLQVLNAIKQIQPCTNSMIANYLMLPINTITPRCLELRNKKLVTYSHTDKCPITSRNALYWKTTKYGELNG